MLSSLSRASGALALFAALALVVPSGAHATQVRMDTLLGVIDIQLFDDEAPATVANFLDYMNRGDYDDSFIHRSAVKQNGTPFVIQGGGFFFDGQFRPIPTDPPVVNEFGRSNLRGTLAMARSPGVVNSATSQWFFNLDDNSFLDTADEGFTVFGEVLFGMDVVDAIAALPRFNASQINPAFGEIPLADFTVGDPVGQHLVTVNSISTIPEPTTGLLLLSGLAGLAWRGRASA